MRTITKWLVRGAVLFGAAIAFVVPAEAAITAPWNATSTDKGYISPNLINGNNPWLVISGTGTSTFAGPIKSTCFSVDGTTCITGGGGGSGTVTQINTTWPIIGGPITTTGTLTFGGLSTSTAPVQGNIPYFSGPNTFANVATGTISNGTGISVTAGQSVIGSGLTITNSSPLSGLTATFPFSFSNPTLTWLGLSTSSPGITAGQPVYATGVNTIASVASSTFLTSIGGQASGNYITALTGDVTASGPGSAAATLATVNSDVGSFTNANITVNAKGLITAASSGSAGSSGLSTTSPLSDSNLLVYSTLGAGSAYGVATSSTGTASTILFLDASQHTVIPEASTTNVTASNAFYGTRLIDTSGHILNWSGLELQGAGASLGDDMFPWVKLKATYASSTDETLSGNLYLSALTPGQLTYVGGTDERLKSVATTTLGFSGPFNGASTLGALVGGSNSTITWTGLATTSQPSSSNILVSNGTSGVYGIATTSFAASGGFSYSGTLGALVGGSAGTLSQVEHRSFSYATSTAWTGTTTIPIESGYGEVWNSVVCFTDAGTLGVDFYHSTNHLNYIPTASTTNNTITFTTNNTITAADKTYVDVGTPASSPTKINCTVKDTI